MLLLMLMLMLMIMLMLMMMLVHVGADVLMMMVMIAMLSWRGLTRIGRTAAEKYNEEANEDGKDKGREDDDHGGDDDGASAQETASNCTTAFAGLSLGGICRNGIPLGRQTEARSTRMPWVAFLL